METFGRRARQGTGNTVDRTSESAHLCTHPPHCSCPQDNEAFLHRSGRTGRAGKQGTAVVLFTERDARSLGLILRSTKVTNAELVGAPDPADVMRTSSRSVLGKLDKVRQGAEGRCCFVDGCVGVGH